MWSNIWNRIKSPVVAGQLISGVAALVVLVLPEIEPTVKTVVAVILYAINAFASLNNPTDKDHF